MKEHLECLETVIRFQLIYLHCKGKAGTLLSFIPLLTTQPLLEG